MHRKDNCWENIKQETYPKNLYFIAEDNCFGRLKVGDSIVTCLFFLINIKPYCVIERDKAAIIKVFKNHLYTIEMLKLESIKNWKSSYSLPTTLFLNECTITSYEQKMGVHIIVSYRAYMQEIAAYLKLSSNLVANISIDCIISDKLGEEFRFTITYIVKSFIGNTTFWLITKTNEVLPVISLHSIYPAFEWAEREVWDMMGIVFIKHSDLRRLLTDYGFSGHPLRKDFPVSGYKEVYFSDTAKLVEYSELEVPQVLRTAVVNAIQLNGNA